MDNTEVARFFNEMPINLFGNTQLREPQIAGYTAIRDYLKTNSAPCYVQLPVGCGKTGLMGLTPFGIAEGRVLIVAPNVVIRDNIKKELNIGDPTGFYMKRKVITPKDGPFLSELKAGANMHDCDAAHIVVANIQQFQRPKWYEAFPRDYFKMILMDEGHHNVAASWEKMFDYFDSAKVVSYTATPMRSDGQTVAGECVYRFGYKRSMMLGYISQIDAVFVKPSEVVFTVEGKTQTLTLDEVQKMKEKDWFSKGVALSETCNRSVVNASIAQLHEVRKYGTPRQIIAVACSLRHAEQVARLYREHQLQVEVLRGDLADDEKKRIESSLRVGATDVIVQVNMLGEGYDLPTLSVAAVFRPYRSLSPYVQFVGRILRLAAPDQPYSIANQVYLVSHVGLNDERWWSDFTNFDKDDQEFFQEFLQDEERDVGETERSPRMTLRPFMRVLRETIDSYQKKGFLRKIDEVLIRDLFDTMREKGFDPTEVGLTEDVMRRRLQAGSFATEVEAFNPIVQPQARKEALKGQLAQEARSIADTVLNRLDLPHRGKELLAWFSGTYNTQILVRLAQSEQNKVMGLNSGQRVEAGPDQLAACIEASADIADKLTAFVRGKMRDAS